MLTRSELAQRVERGAALLDGQSPGWYDRISLPSLAMDICTRCILGQLYSHYDRGLQALNFEPRYQVINDYIESKEAAACGFALHDSEDNYLVWRQMTELWIEQIRARRGEVAPEVAAVIERAKALVPVEA